MSGDDFRFMTRVRVRWAECDAQGIVFNGAYYTYLEVAQAEYYRNLGFSLYRLGELGLFDTAVVKVTLEFKAPARVDEMLELYLRTSHVGNSSIAMDLEICRPGEADPLTLGSAIYVSYDRDMQRSCPVPSDIRQLVTHFEATGQVLPREQFPRLLPGANQ